MAVHPISELMAPDWAQALAGQEQQIHAMGEFLRAEIAAGRGYLPDGDRVPGHPIGLSFAVGRDVRPLPKSLANIYLELQNDLGIAPAPHGDLTGWFEQGVLLLNRCLTVQPGRPAAHRGKGWEQVTGAAIDALVARGGPLVAILWGRDARSLAPMLTAGGIPVIESSHPSPLSARSGFFGSRPFSRANLALAAAGAPPIDWDLNGR